MVISILRVEPMQDIIEVTVDFSEEDEPGSLTPYARVVVFIKDHDQLFSALKEEAIEQAKAFLSRALSSPSH